VQSQNTFGFLVNWYAAFPEYANNSLFITGESYAGIYVPTLANRILVSNNAGATNIPLVGFAVGNGCIGNSVGTCGDDNDAYKIEVDFFAGHAMIDQPTYSAINAECGDYSNPTQKCVNLVNGALGQIGNINIYNVYDTCGDDTVRQQPLASVFGRARAPNAALRNIRDPVVCVSSDYGNTYLNNADVRKAIHVDGVNLPSWTVCPGVDYNANLVSLLPTYPDLIKAYRVLIYSGDADACVPYNGSEEWTRKLGIAPTNPWHSYYVNSGGSNHVGGYVTNYGTNFQYVTIKHAGHMVPKFEPETAFYMFSQWLNNKPL
jgi:carboxypeptidase C (cathepsin A)